MKIFVNNSTIILQSDNPGKDVRNLHFNKEEADGDSKNKISLLIRELLHNSSPGSIVVWGKHPDELLGHFSENLINIYAAGGLVQNPKGQVLFIKRKGKWDMPKGKPEAKEKHEETALREVEEECGISGLKIITHLPTTYHIYELMTEMYVLKKSYWFHMISEDWDNAMPQYEEQITEIRWIDIPVPAEILHGAFPSIKELTLFFQAKCL